MSTTPTTLFTLSIFVHFPISLLLVLVMIIFQCLLQVEPPLSLGLHDGVGVGDVVPELFEPDHADQPPRLRHVRLTHVHHREEHVNLQFIWNEKCLRIQGSDKKWVLEELV